MKTSVLLIFLIYCLCLVSSGVVVQNPLCLVRAFEKSKMQLNDMNNDCLLMILEKLKFHELLNMAQTNKHISILAENIFRRRFMRKSINIAGPFHKDAITGFHISEDEITFENYALTLAAIRTFGHQFQHLKIDYKHMSKEQRQEINTIIAERSYYSLTSLSLQKLDENDLLHFQNPFKNVQNLTVTGKLTILQESWKLNELFPAIRRLYLKDISALGPNMLDVEFPQLEHLTVEIPILLDLTQPIDMLEKRNPQIRELNMYYCTSFDYLKMSSENLPNLESLQVNLEILGDDYDGSKITFPNVKKFITSWGEFDFTKIITFNELQELDLTCENCDGAQFAAQSIHLNHLHLAQHSLQETDILELNEKLPNLSELSIDDVIDVRERTIFELIDGHKNLKKFRLGLPNHSICETLKKHFELQWSTECNDSEILLDKLAPRYSFEK